MSLKIFQKSSEIKVKVDIEGLSKMLYKTVFYRF